MSGHQPKSERAEESIPKDEPKTTTNEDGAALQVDLYGIKAKLEPVDTGDPEPGSWKEVGHAVNAKLRSIVVNLFGLPDDCVVGLRRLVRGLARIPFPKSKASQIEASHQKADRLEAERQEKAEATKKPLSAAAAAIQLEALLEELQSRGTVAVEVRDLGDGRQALVIVKPEDRQFAVDVADKALPAPEKKPRTKQSAAKKKAPRKASKKKPAPPE